MAPHGARAADERPSIRRDIRSRLARIIMRFISETDLVQDLPEFSPGMIRSEFKKAGWVEWGPGIPDVYQCLLIVTRAFLSEFVNNVRY